jgi:phosphate transport system permease protein
VRRSVKPTRPRPTRRAEPPPTLTELAGPTWAPSATTPAWGLAGLVLSTLLTAAIAMALAVPVGLAAAAAIAFGTRGRAREVLKLSVELVAAVPSVVVGFVGLQLLGPLLGRAFARPGGLSALNGGILLAVMALPTIVSIAEDALRSVPRALSEASLALGADRLQTLVHVVAPAARSGLVAACMLGLGRAIGETMTVLMATGNAAAIPSSLLDPVRTMTATIAIELGEVPAASTHYHALFLVGLALFLLTLLVQLAADLLVRRGATRGGAP